MKKELEEMLEVYKRLVETTGTTSRERVSLDQQRRVLWGQIRQIIKEHPKSLQMAIYRSVHPEKVFTQWLIQRDRNRKFKAEVLTHYGNGELACVKCGFLDISALSIDHIEGGGNKQRNGKLRASTAFYKWLKKEGYPAGYQTLCMNCQFVKRFEREEHV